MRDPKAVRRFSDPGLGHMPPGTWIPRAPGWGHTGGACELQVGVARRHSWALGSKNGPRFGVRILSAY